MSERMQEARMAVVLALQSYGVAVRYQNDTMPAWECVQGKIDALIAAVRAERVEDTARLDWLCGSQLDGASSRFALAWRLWDGEGDFRDAIDAARGAR